ncbi:hemin uptake protein HemP [Dyella agri]|uniref:Hemin uptake protein HemP n=1 Tax=Dyella agri TaxID=1926869 RepID=A0ABW8KCJ1_9GAMM
MPAVTSRLASPLSLRPRTSESKRVVRRVSSQSLLDGERELVIQHQGSEYHLRLTRNDKLILTK